MPLRVGFATSDHCHFAAYLAAFRSLPEVEVVGIWDRPGAPTEHGLPIFPSLDALLPRIDALVILSRNREHAEHIEKAAAQGLHILCEKPLVTTYEEAAVVEAAIRGKSQKFMVCFPCRYAPSFHRLRERVAAGDAGCIRAICATNHGSWPEGLGAWFVDPIQSGGGALADHIVHVADLLWLLLGEEPSVVQAQVSHNLKQRAGCEDSALVTLSYPSGIFATIDSSWSRPSEYRTWGDVTMNVVCEGGVMELDMFSQSIDRYRSGRVPVTAGYGSDTNDLLIRDFVRCIVEDLPSPVPFSDGLSASKVMIRAYESLSL